MSIYQISKLIHKLNINYLVKKTGIPGKIPDIPVCIHKHILINDCVLIFINIYFTTFFNSSVSFGTILLRSPTTP